MKWIYGRTWIPKNLHGPHTAFGNDGLGRWCESSFPAFLILSHQDLDQWCREFSRCRHSDNTKILKTGLIFSLTPLWMHATFPHSKWNIFSAMKVHSKCPTKCQLTQECLIWSLWRNDGFCLSFFFISSVLTLKRNCKTSPNKKSNLKRMIPPYVRWRTVWPGIWFPFLFQEEDKY